MKRLIFIFMIIACTAQAQVPDAFKFQAVIRGASGAPIANDEISVRASILRGSAEGDQVYSEIHLATTSLSGVVNLEIGNGGDQDGIFAEIDWSSDTYFVKIEMDPDGGSSFLLVGTSQLLSVPYALYAKHAETAETTRGPWVKDDFDNGLSYQEGKVTIGASGQESPSGLFINVPVPTSSETRSNGLFIQANDVISRGLPLWIRSNTSSQTYGTGENQTLGRMFRMQDQRFGFEAIWDFGIDPNMSMYITGGNNNFNQKLTITTDGKVGVNNASPGYELDVTGTINANNILINGEPLTSGGETESLWTKDFDNNISYTTGRVNIGTTYAESPSGLFINVPIPTSYETRSNGLFIQANDVISRGFPLWIRSNTSSQSYGLDENQTMGRMFRMQDQRFGFEAIWDFGIDANKSMYIIGGNNNFNQKLTITTDGNLGIGTATPLAKLDVTGGDVYINNINSGVIMKSPNGSCFRMTVSDAGAPVFTPIGCPN